MEVKLHLQSYNVNNNNSTYYQQFQTAFLADYTPDTHYQKKVQMDTLKRCIDFYVQCQLFSNPCCECLIF